MLTALAEPVELLVGDHPLDVHPTATADVVTLERVGDRDPMARLLTRTDQELIGRWPGVWGRARLTAQLKWWGRDWIHGAGEAGGCAHRANAWVRPSDLSGPGTWWRCSGS